jgi:sulfide:quinone oxidoreductase
MKRLVILGAGTAGTMMANHLDHELNPSEWEIVIIDERKENYYQPGYLFLPFDIYTPEDIIKPIQKFIPKKVQLLNEKIEKINAKENEVWLSKGESLHYDVLIIATVLK